MLILRSFPEVADIPANRDFRRYFYTRWGRENCVISARARQAAYPDFTQRLSVKAAWGGPERYFLDGRTIAVDDENYLVINDQRTYGSALRSDRPIHSFCVFFAPGLPEQTLGSMLTSADHLLDSGDGYAPRAVEFAEHLRPHDRLVSRLLHYIAHHADSGLDDALWYDEQFSFLLERLLRAHRASLAVIHSLKAARSTTQREILRRIGWSTDFMNTYYMRPLRIGDLAKAASLSQFHFIRSFRAIHGRTPFSFLQQKRAGVARRLLQTTDFGQDEIASRVGFESRSTMFRHLRSLTGAGARTLRRSAKPC